MNTKKKIVSICITLMLCSALFSNVINDAQIIPPESSLYSDFLKLQANAKVFSFTNNTPLSVNELKFYLIQ